MAENQCPRTRACCSFSCSTALLLASTLPCYCCCLLSLRCPTHRSLPPVPLLRLLPLRVAALPAPHAAACPTPTPCAAAPRACEHTRLPGVALLHAAGAIGFSRRCPCIVCACAPVSRPAACALAAMLLLPLPAAAVACAQYRRCTPALADAFPRSPRLWLWPWPSACASV